MTVRKHPAWHERPMAMLSLVGAMVTIAAVVVPWVTGFLGRYQTVEDAKRQAAQHDRSIAWIVAGQTKMEATVNNRWVNDCDLKAEQRKPTALEKSQCEQYRQDLADAKLRATEAFKAAQAISNPRRKDHEQ